MIDREDDNINEFDNFDQILNFGDTQDFREGEPVVVTATIQAGVRAIGSGSHAEVNFKDGDANFIQPQGLWFIPKPQACSHLGAKCAVSHPRFSNRRLS